MTVFQLSAVRCRSKLGGAEIVLLVTDVSGSMSGTPVADLRNAASKQFIDNFEDIEERSVVWSRVVCRWFAVVDYSLQTQFSSQI